MSGPGREEYGQAIVLLRHVRPNAEAEGQPNTEHETEFFRRPLPTEAIAALVENLQERRAPGQSRELDFTPWGGAFNSVRADATAFVHRDELFLLKHAVVIDPAASSGEREAARRWLARSWASVHPWGSGRLYQNFPNPDLTDWAQAYYGTNYDRLLRVKARYDPGDFFPFPAAASESRPGK